MFVFNKEHFRLYVLEMYRLLEITPKKLNKLLITPEKKPWGSGIVALHVCMKKLGISRWLFLNCFHLNQHLNKLIDSNEFLINYFIWMDCIMSYWFCSIIKEILYTLLIRILNYKNKFIPKIYFFKNVF